MVSSISHQPSAISPQPSAFSLNSSSLISQHPQQCRGFTFLRHRLHLRLTRLSIRTFQAHEAQHFLMRIPAGFLTKAKLEPSGEFLRLLKRLSLHTAENFSALSAPQHRWNVLGKIWECLGTFGKKLGKNWEKLSYSYSPFSLKSNSLTTALHP